MSSTALRSWRIIIAFLTTMFCLSLISAAAQYPEEAYLNYNYDVWGNSVPAPVFYTCKKEHRLAYDKATDIFVYEDRLYLLDAGGQRIAVIDPVTGSELENITLSDEARKAGFHLSDARGFFVFDEDAIFVALYSQGAVIKIDRNGQVLMTFEKPKTGVGDEGITYNPVKPAVYADGSIFVVADGVYKGLMQYDAQGRFLRFFGANTVAPTLQDLVTRFWRSLFSEAQKSRLMRVLPTDYASIYYAPDRFLYTVLDNADNSKYEIKKLSPYGDNILNYRKSTAPGVVTATGDYGDLEQKREGTAVVDTAFIDLAVNDAGIIFALDGQRGKVFAYDQESNLLGIFGVKGDQKGTFSEPVAIEVSGQTVYVLDQQAGTLFTFVPTYYARQLFEAASLYHQGLYKQALPSWKELEKLNANLPFIYQGLGRAAMEGGDNKNAMAYFLQARDLNGYNDAFTSWRNGIIRTVFPIIFAAVMLSLCALALWMYRKGKATAGYMDREKSVTPFYVMVHPMKGYERMKDEGEGSLDVALLILACVYIVRIISIRGTGFLFNSYASQSINLVSELVQMAGVFAMWVVCSWAVGTLQDAEGRIPEIFKASSYAFTPYILFQSVSVLLSNILALRESGFVYLASNIGLIWSVMLMLVSVARTNRFSFKSLALHILLVSIGMLFILFLLVMGYSLLGQLGSFIAEVYNEFILRV